MIHATVSGLIVDDATFSPAYRSETRSHAAVARFQLSTRKHYSGYQVVECEFQGRGAATLQQHLVAGKRILATGELTLQTSGGFPRLMLTVKNIELVGGTPRYHARRNAERDDEHDEADHV
jgi:hypothetical protein